jgi:hypothetical protein
MDHHYLTKEFNCILIYERKLRKGKLCYVYSNHSSYDELKTKIKL